MRKNSISSYLVTLIFGIVFSYFFIGPLAAVIYLLIWIDIFVIAKIEVAEMMGIETLTIAAIISGIVFGPLAGFFFSLFGISLIAILLILFVQKTLSNRLPNIHFVTMGFSAALSGILAAHLPLLAVVIIAVFFKHLFFFIISFGIASLGVEVPLDILSTFVNIAFSAIVIMMMQQMGLLGSLV